MRYEKYVKRFQSRKEAEKNTEQKLNEFAEHEGFVADFVFHKLPSGISTKKLVPSPDYTQDRLNHLTIEQQIEFKNSFMAPISIEKIKKHKEIRCNSYLVFMIKEYDKFPAGKILKECELLAEKLNVLLLFRTLEKTCFFL